MSTYFRKVLSNASLFQALFLLVQYNHEQGYKTKNTQIGFQVSLSVIKQDSTSAERLHFFTAPDPHRHSTK